MVKNTRTGKSGWKSMVWRPVRRRSKPNGFGIAVIFCLVFFIQPDIALFSQTRPFAAAFPSCGAEARNAAFSSEGYLYSGERSESLTLLPAVSGNTAFSKSSLGPNPGFFVEALRIVPRGSTTLLQIYNALEQIGNLKGRTYYSASAKRRLPLFTDAVRIEGPGKLKAFLPDPPRAFATPFGERFYVRLTDARFGNCFYEISLSTGREGILYKINNFKNITFGPIPVVKEKTMTVLLYIEPLEEGLALYCLAGAEVSDFIAKHVDIPSALNKRMDVFIEWLLDGI